MFCYQCEQTAKGTGCTIAGVCGKDHNVASLQDFLLYVTKGIAMYANRSRKMGVKNDAIDIAVTENLFTCITNVNFDQQRIKGLIERAEKLLAEAKLEYANSCKKYGAVAERLEGPADVKIPEDIASMIKFGESISIEKRKQKFGEDITGLQELLTYGVKGTAAYADHAHVLGKKDDSIFAFFHEALDYLTKDNPTIDELLGLNLKCGEINLKTMGLLSEANTGTYGHPVPTKVRINPLKGKAILISGHDLKDLEELLKQTEGKGINIYTHGEMLPAHGYPHLKKYAHLAGNYGGAWQDQRKEFNEFPGAILMTTNCIQKPQDGYIGRIFTSGLVAWPGVNHIKDHDFTPVIKAALEAPGFSSDGDNKEIIVGFGHNAVLGVADKVIDAVKSGAIKHFFLIGGCDGAKPGRNYYTEFAEKAPKDTVILTLACGKYRFNKLEFGDISGIPRLLDVGQCNDAYSAIQIALALAGAFKCGVNDLPLSMILSWYEQKAVCILLTLLYLGIKNIKLGPSLPACVTPTVLKVLIDKFNISPIKTVDEDLASILKK